MILLPSEQKLSEREWAAIHSPRFQDDAQGYYFAQMKAILGGEVDMNLNDDHIAAWNFEVDKFKQSLKKQELF